MRFIPPRNSFEGYGEIITAAILWSLVGVFAKKISGMSPQNIIFYRLTIAWIILFIVLLVSGKLDKIKLKDKKTYLVLFSIFQVLTMLMFFTSILEASLSIAVLLLYTAPVYVTILSPVLLKESFTKKGIIALVLSVTGIVLIVDPGKLEISHLNIGILAGMLSGILYALQIMTSKYIGKNYPGYIQAFWSFAIGTLLLMPAGLVPVQVVFGNILFLLFLAIFPTILAISLYFNGLKKVRTASASILGLIEPLSAVILAVLILDEQVSMLVMLGGALILTGAAIVTQEK